MVVQSVGTDAWTGLRQELARWIGQGDEQLERAALARLDRTASALETAEAAEVEQVRAHQQALWQDRIKETFLSGTGQVQAAADLAELLDRHNRAGSVHHEISGGTVHGSVVQQHIVGSNLKIGHTSPGPENDPDDDWPQES
ncbi:hypothetical protein [Streptomyces albogriseolus]|uniref:hypothetical protein n=1 Tax=Streptomyces TaxID=1883 RepID=UPI00348183A6